MAAIRKVKEEKPVLAICYDFDKTLSPDDMQAQGYIQSVWEGDVASFWKKSNKIGAIHRKCGYKIIFRAEKPTAHRSEA